MVENRQRKMIESFGTFLKEMHLWKRYKNMSTLKIWDK